MKQEPLLMMIGGTVMKLLKIENNQGHFLGTDGDYLPVDKITKGDILRLVDLALGQDVGFDEYDDERIKNQAHQIIYKNIYEKLLVLTERKQEYLDESERLYLAENEKYQETPPQEAE